MACHLEATGFFVVTDPIERKERALNASSTNSEPGGLPKVMTVPRFMAAKQSGQKLAMVTGYDFLWGALLDQAGADAILVGDSLGMVVQGRATTLPVTLDEMIYHAEMVARGVQRALVIADMPFMTYQVSPQQAVENAGIILKRTGVSGVKLEGGVNQARTIEAMTAADIPVMAHIGMRPQAVRARGSMGKVERDVERLLDDALAAESAGAFGIVLELVPGEAAREVTERLGIPTIGIGAGPDCDGQVLVTPDLLGLTDGFEPRFLKKYANLRSEVIRATRAYCDEVRSSRFPGPEHTH